MKRSGCIWLVVAGLALLALIYAAGSWYFAGVLLDRDTEPLAETKERLEVRSFSEQGYPEPEEVTIAGADVQLAAWYFANDAPAECGVVLLHGYTGNRYGATQYMPYFWERGCDLLLYDARGHGESEDSPHTYGYYEKEDAAAAVDWLAGRGNLDHGEIGVIGVSYGAATGLQMIPLRPDVAFVVADSSYQDLYAIADYQAGEQFGSWARLFLPGAAMAAFIRTGMNVWDVSPQDAVVGADTPVLLVHALEDEFTPASHSETIYARSNQDTTVLEITDWGASHGRSIIEDEESFWELVESFLLRYAPQFGAET